MTNSSGKEHDKSACTIDNIQGDKYNLDKQVMRKRLLSTCALLLAVFAMGLITYSAYMPTKAWLSQKLIAYNWDENLLALQTHKQVKPPWPWADTTAIAKMDVPRLNKSVVLLQGTDPTTLAFSAGVMHQYSDLTAHSPFVVAGHRDTHFEFLQFLVLNDVISLTDVQGKTQRYKIEDMSVINAKESPLLVDESDNSLILITCYPFNALRAGGSLRYVVKAKMLLDDFNVGEQT
jgi:sortase A